MEIKYEAWRYLDNENDNRQLTTGTRVQWRTGFIYGAYEGYHFSKTMALDLADVCSNVI